MKKIALCAALIAGFSLTLIQAAPKSDARNIEWKSHISTSGSFELSYPKDWLSPSKDPLILRTSELKEALRFSAMDPESEPGGYSEGGSFPPELFVFVFGEKEFNPKLFDPSCAELRLIFAHRPVKIQNLDGLQNSHSCFVTEGSEQILNWTEVKSQGKVYVIALTYTIAGCSNMESSSQPDCRKKNKELTLKSEKIYQRTIQSFKILHRN